MSVHSYASLTSTVYGRPYTPTTPKTKRRDSTSTKSSSVSLSKAEMTFGKLVSSYGFCGGIPSLPARTERSKPHKVTLSPSPTHTSSGTSPKDYEAALASLSSSYGFSGAPVLPHRKS